MMGGFKVWEDCGIQGGRVEGGGALDVIKALKGVVWVG